MAYTYQYPRPSVTVDCVIFLKEDNAHKVLLIKRGRYPFEGQWAFPGGFVEMDETLAASARRELEEETGLKNIELEQMYTFGDPGRDPRGRTIAVVHYGFTHPGNAAVKGGDDASEARWFDLDDLPELAFDHDKIMKMAIEKLI
ncbi:MAG: NUDIX hydrolase [Bacteroidales bacterium]|nr:NUDIX hydrolase [Bacteroidales bacterium]MCF8397541.1 NUDIX hydrolase [Bacteroidales bacterium]